VIYSIEYEHSVSFPSSFVCIACFWGVIPKRVELLRSSQKRVQATPSCAFSLQGVIHIGRHTASARCGEEMHGRASLQNAISTVGKFADGFGFYGEFSVSLQGNDKSKQLWLSKLIEQ
jgi:hypothetical protein